MGRVAPPGLSRRGPVWAGGGFILASFYGIKPRAFLQSSALVAPGPGGDNREGVIQTPKTHMHRHRVPGAVATSGRAVGSLGCMEA
ncbi:hypothetical protein HPA02_28700 [Bisbaumannia pacifica]|uniref:Uncharacterized protein n=1 Tax=Bisbaumannia pacifica TaxID=77098 RepID=A0A510XD03_9GAMM|nr:hypothetical protein HPA02_28700 [Halomonas pacifica]